MSRRIAYRPRYPRMRRLPHPSPRTNKDFLRYRWAYRPQTIHYPKRAPGQSLLSIPWGYRINWNIIGR